MSSAETYATNDKLGLERYVNGLAKYIRTCETPTTIALQGGWGTGKTTFYHLIKERIQDEEKKSSEYDRCSFVELNTWQSEVIDDTENITLLLIEQVLNKVHPEGDDEKNQSIGRKLRNVLRRPAVATTKIATELLTGNGSFAESAGGIVDRFLDSAREDESPSNKYNLAEELKQEIGSNIKDGSRLVIFIDDLDRLRPGRAVELLEGMKNFLDCRGCVFVLALDQQVVFAGVREKFGTEEGQLLENLFFDKIIQVPFLLPVNNYNIETYLEDLLTSQDRSNINTKPYASALNLLQNSDEGITPLGHPNNPRAIKRHVYMYKLYREILGWSASNDDAREACLFALIVLYARMPEKYNQMVVDCCETEYELPQEIANWIKEAQSAVDNTDNDLNKTMEEVLQELGKVLADSEENGITLTQLLNELREEIGAEGNPKLPANTPAANKILESMGYLSGRAGHWEITDDGKKIGMYAVPRTGYTAILYSPQAQRTIKNALRKQPSVQN